MFSEEEEECNLADKEHNEKIIFYDFETFVNRKHVHVPFLVCAVVFDHRERWKAYSLDCVDKFLLHFRWRKYAGATFVAHEGS